MTENLDSLHSRSRVSNQNLVYVSFAPPLRGFLLVGAAAFIFAAYPAVVTAFAPALSSTALLLRPLSLVLLRDGFLFGDSFFQGVPHRVLLSVVWAERKRGSGGGGGAVVSVAVAVM